MSENILSIHDFKFKRELLAEEQSLDQTREYFQMLDFHGLIQETHALIDELDAQALSVDIVDRSVCLLQEYENRCKTKSPQMLETLTKMRERIELRVEQVGLGRH